MRGRNNRRRGQSGEREVAGILRDHLGINVKRKLGQERDSGNDIDLPGFAIEVKRRKRIAGLYEWLSQCAGEHANTPAVLLRADGQPWVAVMLLDDFIRLAREEIVGAQHDET